jgi:MYXO-CTERM domain-containing protein
MRGNLATATPGLVDQPGVDYHLAAGSPAIDVGVDPGMGATMALAAVSQYRHPMAVEPRAAVGVVDVGAYEFGNVAAGGDGAVAGDATPVGGSASGCGCRTQGAPTGGLLLAAVAALVVRRRR